MMGGYGSDQLAEATPTMDTLAAQGIQFDVTRGTPSWLAIFQDSGDTIATSDKTLSVFSKNFPAGEIVLGGMGANQLPDFRNQ